MSDKKEENKNFRLYFAGGHSNLPTDLIGSLGGNRLGSQLLDRRGMKYWIDLLDQGKATGRLMIDSGAHTAFYTGQALDVDEYMKYVDDIDEYVDVFVQVDKVPGSSTTVRDVKEFDAAPKNNWDNYLYMRERVKSPDKLLPVFHIGEDFKWLRNMLEWVGPNGEKVPYIGIAPRKEDGWPDKINFISECFKIIKFSSNPDVKTHALGMTKLSVLEVFPFTSADSTSWILNAAMGCIMTPWGSIVISSKSANKKGHYKSLPVEGRRNVDEYLNKYGVTAEEAAESYQKRSEVNINYLLEWANNYKYTPRTVWTSRLF